MVTDAKERKAKGDIESDVWREDLEPRTAVCARTVPILDREAKMLRESLAVVRLSRSDHSYGFMLRDFTCTDGRRKQPDPGSDRAEQETHRRCE